MACNEAHINIAVISSVLLVSNMGKYYSLVQNHSYAEKKIKSRLFSYNLFTQYVKQLKSSQPQSNSKNYNPKSNTVKPLFSEWTIG